MLEPPKRTRDLRSSDQICYLFPALRPRRVKGLYLWRHQHCGIISPVKLELQKQFTLSEEKLKTFYFNQAFPT